MLKQTHTDCRPTNVNTSKHILVFIHVYIETAVLFVFKTYINAPKVQSENKKLLRCLQRFFLELSIEGEFL